MASFFSRDGLVARQARKLGWNAREWDKSHGLRCDVEQPQTMRIVLQELASQKIGAVFMVPPAASFSAARQPAIRSCDSPWGLDDGSVDTTGQSVLKTGNRSLKAALAILGKCMRTRVPFIMQLPQSSLAWSTQEVAELASAPGCRVVSCDQCMYGQKWRKASSFLCHLVDMQDLLRLTKKCCSRRNICRHSNRPHVGVPWSPLGHSCPTALGRHIAFCLTAPLRTWVHGA